MKPAGFIGFLWRMARWLMSLRHVLIAPDPVIEIPNIVRSSCGTYLAQRLSSCSRLQAESQDFSCRILIHSRRTGQWPQSQVDAGQTARNPRTAGLTAIAAGTSMMSVSLLPRHRGMETSTTGEGNPGTAARTLMLVSALLLLLLISLLRSHSDSPVSA